VYSYFSGLQVDGIYVERISTECFLSKSVGLTMFLSNLQRANESVAVNYYPHGCCFSTLRYWPLPKEKI